MALKERVARVNSQIKKEISDIIQKDTEISRGLLVSVTQVLMTKDLRFGKIFVSIYGDGKNKNEIFNNIQKAKKNIRWELGKKIKLRYVPELKFFLDDSIEYGSKITKLLNQINKRK
jgi:ribosome-binding factor A